MNYTFVLMIKIFQQFEKLKESGVYYVYGFDFFIIIVFDSINVLDHKAKRQTSTDINQFCQFFTFILRDKKREIQRVYSILHNKLNTEIRLTSMNTNMCFEI